MTKRDDEESLEALERRKPTPESVLKKVLQCETEVGQNMEAMRSELEQHKDAFISLKEEWDEFIKDFAEMLKIFKNAKGFFTVLGWIGVAAKWTIGVGLLAVAVWTLITTGHWPGIGK